MFGNSGSEFIYDSFVDLMAGGFSENQALKLIALMTSCSEFSDGMPAGQFDAMDMHPASGDEDD